MRFVGLHSIALVVVLVLFLAEFVVCDFRNSIYDRGIVSKKTIFRTIVREHSHTASPTIFKERHLSGNTLGYVTPWNSRGYDLSKQYCFKFTHISPVWLSLEINPDPKGDRFIISGEHDIDDEYVRELRACGVKVVPRLNFMLRSAQEYQDLMDPGKGELQLFLHNLDDLLIKHALSGFTLELGITGVPQLFGVLEMFLGELRTGLQDGVELGLVVGPKNFGGSEAQQLIDKGVVDFFSLMTYDYSHPAQPGPNAPLPWVLECVDHLLSTDYTSGFSDLSRELNVPEAAVSVKPAPGSSLILMGINFYGNDYITQGSSIGHENTLLGTNYISILRRHKPRLQWNKGFHEHSFEYSGMNNKHVVWYPTVQSINERLALAEKLGIGISLWELGQGLDYFFELL